MTDGCGPPPWTQCAVFGPDGSCGRTHQPSLGLTMENPSGGFSARWPRWATWDRTGAYVLPTWAAATAATGCSSLDALLPTPAAGNPNDGEDPASYHARRAAAKERTGNGNGFGLALAQAVQLLPTPTARDWKDGEPCGAVEENALLGRVAWRFPSDPLTATTDGGLTTPSTRTLTDSSGPTDAERTGRLLSTPRTSDTNGAGEHGDGGPDLRTVATRLLPTPTSQAAKHALADRGAGTPDDANLWTVAQRIGATTPPPSPATPPCSADQPRLPWTTGDASRPPSPSG